jgi:hypothetical protein
MTTPVGYAVNVLLAIGTLASPDQSFFIEDLFFGCLAFPAIEHST